MQDATNFSIMENILNEALSLKGRIAIKNYVAETEDDKISWQDFNDLGYNTLDMSEDDFIEGIRIFKKNLNIEKSLNVTDNKKSEEPIKKPEAEEKVEPANDESSAELANTTPESDTTTTETESENTSEPEVNAEDTGDSEDDDDGADDPTAAPKVPMGPTTESGLEKELASYDGLQFSDEGNDYRHGIYQIPIYKWPKVYEALERCKKKLPTKFSYEIIGEEDVPCSHYSYSYCGFGQFMSDRTVYRTRVYNVKITAELKNEDWEVVAVAEQVPSQDHVCVVSVTDVPVPEKFNNLSKIDCEHCHQNRSRRVGAIVHNLKTSEFRLVGSACLKDYTKLDPVGVLELAHIHTVSTSVSFGDGGFDDNGPHENSYKYLNLDTALIIAAAAVRLFGYIKPTRFETRWGYSYEDDATTTRRIVREGYRYLQNPRDKITDPEIKQVFEYISRNYDELKDFCDKARDYMATVDFGDDTFKTAVQNALSGRIISKKQVGLISCFPQVYGRFVTEEENKKNASKFNLNNEFYPGKVGDLIDLKNIAKVIKGGQTRTGSYIITIYTDNGYEFTAFAQESDFPSDWDSVSRVTGTIYKFNEFRGKKSTTLNRIKFYTQEDEYFGVSNDASTVPIAEEGKHAHFTIASVDAGPEQSASFSWNSITYYSKLTIKDTEGNVFYWSCSNPDIYEHPENLVGKKMDALVKKIYRNNDLSISAYKLGGRVKVLESVDTNKSRVRENNDLENIFVDAAAELDFTNLIDSAMEDDADLQDCWTNAIEKYKDIWNSKECLFNGMLVTDGLKKVTPHYFTSNSYGKEDDEGKIKSFLGRTRHVRSLNNPIEVDIFTATFDMDSDEFFNVLLHEMCHVAAYYVDRSLSHNSTWAYFKDELNNRCGYNIIIDASDLMETKKPNKSLDNLQECHFAELPGYKKKQELNKEFDKVMSSVVGKTEEEKEIEAWQEDEYNRREADFQACLDMYSYDEEGFCDGFTR